MKEGNQTEKRKSNRHGFLPIVTLISLLAGCMGLERSYPEKHSFMLDVTRQGTPSTPIIQGT